MPPKAKAAVAARGRHLSREVCCSLALLGAHRTVLQGVEIKQTQIPLHSPDADDKEPTYDEPVHPASSCLPHTDAMPLRSNTSLRRLRIS